MRPAAFVRRRAPGLFRHRCGPRCRAPGPERSRTGSYAGSRDHGVTAVEFAGWLPLLILVALTGLQLGFVGYAAQQAGSGARAAARVAAQDELRDEYAAAGQQAISDWLQGSYQLDASCGEVATVTASVAVPSVLPFMDNVGEATKTVTMPCD